MKLKNWFVSRNMSWPKVILLAIISAVITAVLLLIPALNETSLHDPGVFPDVWILLAVFIIMNCRSIKDAVLKTFIFFLISQPLIYLIQVPFSALGFGLFMYYRRWFIITLFTIPGAALAFLVKKKNVLSLIILSVANVLLIYQSASYFRTLQYDFPHHLISFIFCIAVSVFFIFALIDKKSLKTAGFIIIAAAFVICLLLNRPQRTGTIYLEEGVWTGTLEDPKLAAYEISEDGTVKVTALKNGSCYLTFENEEGTVHEFYITISGGSLTISSFD